MFDQIYIQGQDKPSVAIQLSPENEKTLAKQNMSGQGQSRMDKQRKEKEKKEEEI